ncbi:sigma-54 interaction domain-containing protein [Brevibacillus agri]|uniref:sigma-54 interaction domain-containing protein n=1 Tax=Brevibacillus agri TaxID=51101 RepID=UPI002E222D75|nr:sigma 54-interacting transcriptional regulator [Brevibacillus agri]MED1822612.1 sigma 54-interacting transcriptional regulator [Brevibacillus agri]MED4572304.1 sigma 54-interacting transcriptional regulator [Brevibacillus agri]
MDHTIVLIAKGTDTLAFLLKELRAYFEPYCKVIGFASHEQIPDLSGVSHVFITTRAPELYTIARQAVPETVPITVLNRFFELRKIKALMQIPPGTTVPVMNNSPVTAQEVIQNLLEVKIDHLNYVPFHPGSTFEERFRYAIIMSIPDVPLPPHVEVIDLGFRKISIHDLIDTGRKVGVPIEWERQYLSAFIVEMSELAKMLGTSYAEVQKLNSQLQSTFQAVKDPVIACNEDGLITFINDVAVELFCPHESVIIGKPYTILKEHGLLAPFFEQEGQEDALIAIDQRQFIVSSHSIRRSHEHLGFVCTLKDVTEIQRLRTQLALRGHTATYSFADIKGSSQPLLHAIELSKKMAKNNQTILLTGENGTGKELFAHAIHQHSLRKNGPFVAINCASLPENLLESELFGYEDGAFTGARKGGKPGLFEQADGGTIFLDEIGDISPAIQVKLLRVLQEKQVIRVGGTGILSVDCRVIAATNRNLEDAVRDGAFREDLFYRLAVLPIEIPALRERTSDIPLLIDDHLKQQGIRKSWSPEVMELLLAHDWRGNIRELKNVVDYAITVSEHPVIGIADLPKRLTERIFQKQSAAAAVPLEDERNLDILLGLYQYYLANKPVGRYQLAHTPVLQANGWTESALRNRLKQLEQLGLVRSGTTRQGTSITRDGIEMLRKYGKI